jgi:hypothetical protein
VYWQGLEFMVEAEKELKKHQKIFFFFLLDNKAKTNKNKNKQKLQEEK